MILGTERKILIEKIKTFINNDFSIKGVEFSIVKSVLFFIYEIFEMELFEFEKLTFSMSPLAIYKKKYGMLGFFTFSDAFELESIDAILFLLLDHDLLDEISTDSSLKEIILCISKNRNNRPVSSSEYKKIIDEYVFYINDIRFFKA